MKTSKKGLDIIKKYEGFRNAPYLDEAGVATIGFGSTYYEDGRCVKMTDPPITMKRADELMKNVLNRFEEDVNYLVTSKINQNQFDALVSFSYNVGTDIDEDAIPEGLGDSTLLKKVNRDPNDPEIKLQFLAWNKAKKNGKKIASKGLTKRRNEEAFLYFTPALEEVKEISATKDLDGFHILRHEAKKAEPPFELNLYKYEKK